MVLFTIAVTAAFIAPITFVHLLTRPIVALNEEAYLKRAVLAAAGLEAPASNADAKALFDGRVEEVAAPAPAPETLALPPEPPAAEPVLAAGPRAALALQAASLLRRREPFNLIRWRIESNSCPGFSWNVRMVLWPIKMETWWCVN